jgi:hypothetical protein
MSTTIIGCVDALLPKSVVDECRLPPVDDLTPQSPMEPPVAMIDLHCRKLTTAEGWVRYRHRGVARSTPLWVRDLSGHRPRDSAALLATILFESALAGIGTRSTAGLNVVNLLTLHFHPLAAAVLISFGFDAGESTSSSCGEHSLTEWPPSGDRSSLRASSACGRSVRRCGRPATPPRRPL